MATRIAPPKAPATTQPITVDDLLRLDAQGERVEVVNGEIVPVLTAGFLHALVIQNINRILDRFARAHKTGIVTGDGLHFILREDAEGVRGSRIPDVSFIRQERITSDIDWSRPFPGAPDLAVEVVSPGESRAETAAKIHDYFAAGTEQVWVVYPEAKELHQYRHEAPKTILVHTHEDELTPGDLLPDLRFAISACFELPSPAAEAPPG